MDALALGVGKLSVRRVLVSVTLDDAQCDDETIGDLLGVAVTEELIDTTDGDRDGLTVAVPVCS